MRGGYLLPGLSLGNGYGLGFGFWGRGHRLEICSVRYGPGVLGAVLCILKPGPRRKLAGSGRERETYLLYTRNFFQLSHDSFRRLRFQVVVAVIFTKGHIGIGIL